MAVHNIVIPVFANTGTAVHAAGTTVQALFRVPANSLPGGGAITLTHVDFTSSVAIAAASAPQYEVIGLGTSFAAAGTPVTALASAAWTAGTARAATIASAVIDPDTYAFLAVQEKQTADYVGTAIITCAIEYVDGR